MRRADVAGICCVVVACCMTAASFVSSITWITSDQPDETCIYRSGEQDCLNYCGCLWCYDIGKVNGSACLSAAQKFDCFAQSGAFIDLPGEGCLAKIELRKTLFFPFLTSAIIFGALACICFCLDWRCPNQFVPVDCEQLQQGPRTRASPTDNSSKKKSTKVGQKAAQPHHQGVVCSA